MTAESRFGSALALFLTDRWALVRTMTTSGWRCAQGHKDVGANAGRPQHEGNVRVGHSPENAETRGDGRPTKTTSGWGRASTKTTGMRTKAMGGWVRVWKRATSRWVRMPTKVTGGLSQVPTKTACIKRAGISPSSDKQCVGWA
ncbi:hypothetical protein B0H14DRAFT_2629856 [Mycena olivaceomarginata]|nr:hypothetical protein B0H14DRAFT_2629856 [Mycena olivaceomarginata]